ARGDGLAGADRLAGEAAGGAGGGERHDVAALDAGECGGDGVEGGGGGGVVGLVGGGDAGDGERPSGDVGRRRRRGGRVVAGLGARERHTGDGDGLAGADRLRRERARRACRAEADGVGADDADERRAAEVRRRGGRRVVHLVRGGDAAHRQRLRRGRDTR